MKLNYNTYILEPKSNEQLDPEIIYSFFDEQGINFEDQGYTNRGYLIGMRVMQSSNDFDSLTNAVSESLNCELYYYWDRYPEDLMEEDPVMISNVISVAGNEILYANMYKYISMSIRRGYNNKEVIETLIDHMNENEESYHRFLAPVLQLNNEKYTEMISKFKNIDFNSLHNYLAKNGLHRGIMGLYNNLDVWLQMQMGSNKKMIREFINYILEFSQEIDSNEDIQNVIKKIITEGGVSPVTLYSYMYGNDNINGFIRTVLTSGINKEYILEFCQAIGWFSNSDHIKYLLDLGVDFKFIKPNMKTIAKYSFISIGKEMTRKFKRK